MNFKIRTKLKAIPFWACVLSVALIAVSNSGLYGEDAESAWTSFRNGGKSEVSHSVTLPKKWSPGKGVEWTAELPGYGQSSPILLGDHVIVTAVEGPQKEQNLVLCLSRSTGKVVWQVAEKSSLPGPSNYMFSRAAPTPMVDANHVFAFFESGDLVAVELSSGNVAWKRSLADEMGPLKSRHGRYRR